ncbi:DUF4302 domain-containing protein [Niabella ginsengisoli]|uniref:DUF4302 domain-containing protein n=1 Tax=Niabella ginsengisoli TaxID=522298 RepID=A0ABS9SQ13_9BACT|nr:DUF4302 domain-containing protein [Niabella ginsengisoli]MCH5600437.1 DUF4302 domain-containing protein [Niabella ginsengisoli]
MAGCVKSPDALFDKDSATRVDEFVKNARSVLQASKEGWEIRYFPSSDLEFGGYTLFAKFTSDNEVTLTSDINDERITSSYAVIGEGGPILTFDTYNKVIHYFSEPGGDNGEGAVDSGLKGDFEFLVLVVEEGRIVLKGKKREIPSS